MQDEQAPETLAIAVAPVYAAQVAAAQESSPEPLGVAPDPDDELFRLEMEVMQSMNDDHDNEKADDAGPGVCDYFYGRDDVTGADLKATHVKLVPDPAEERAGPSDLAACFDWAHIYIYIYIYIYICIYTYICIIYKYKYK
jgi:hypothetical protein